MIAQLRDAWSTRLKREPVVTGLLALTKDSVVYLLGAGLIGLGNFVLIPLYTKYLTPAQFGVYALVEIAMMLIVTLTQLKLDISYLRWFPQCDPDKHGELLGTVLLAGGVAAIAGGSMLVLGARSALGQASLRAETREFAWALLPLVVLENLQGLLLTDLRARRRAAMYSVIAGLRLLVMVAASWFLIAVEHQAIKGVFVGRMVGDACAMAVLVWFCTSGRRLRWAGDRLKELLRFGTPLIWCAFSVVILDASGRYFLNHYGSLEDVGLYAVAIKMASIFQLLVNQPFGVAWGGLMFQIAGWPDARTVYAKILSYLYLGSLSVALILAVTGATLFRIFVAPAYHSALTIFPLVLLVRAVNVLEYPTAIGIYLSGRTGKFAIIYSVGLMVNLTLLFLLVPHYGAFGAAWSWLAAWSATTGLMAFVGQRDYPLPHNWRLLVLASAPWVVILMARHRITGILAGLRWPAQLSLSALIAVAMGSLIIRDLLKLRGGVVANAQQPGITP